MFGRRRPATVTATQDPAGHALSGYQQVIGLEAVPDVLAIERVHSLMNRIGLGLAGHSGLVMGYDRGDPATSLTGPVVGIPLPTAAIAMVGRSAAFAAMPTATYSDMALTDPALDPYMALLWQRMANR